MMEFPPQELMLNETKSVSTTPKRSPNHFNAREMFMVFALWPFFVSRGPHFRGCVLANYLSQRSTSGSGEGCKVVLQPSPRLLVLQEASRLAGFEAS